MILRIWRAEVDSERLEEYRRFERKRCLPMLHKQPGLLGVLFLRAAKHQAVSLTIWEDVGAVDAMGSSPSYRRTDRELAEGGLLAGGPWVELLEVEDGDLRPEALVGALNRTRRTGSSGSSAAGSFDR